MRWRKWNRIIHRDLGYVCFGLVLVYAISGFAVNHKSEWNPNYAIEKNEYIIKPFEGELTNVNELIKHICCELKISGEPKNSFRPSAYRIQIFYEKHSLDVDLEKWTVKEEKILSRAVFREVNFLHLNVPKKIWTYIADAFAVGLVFLAISGLFMIKGKKGITGRGLWLVLAGISIPIVFLLIYF